MAVSDDRLDRDPQIASLLASAANETPPAALDDAIRAAARREVSARPVSASGESVPPVARTRRNWYVPVSIAAVVVLSVSLVTLMQEEKGSELMRAPGAASSPSPIPATPPAAAPPAPAASADTPAQHAAPGERLQPQDIPATTADAAASESRVVTDTAKPRRDKSEALPDSATVVDGLRKEPTGGMQSRQQAAKAGAAALPAPDADGSAVGTLPQAPVPERQKRADPFPAASEREAPAVSPSTPPPPVAAVPPSPPMQARREAAEAPPARAAAAPGASVAENALPQASPPLADNRAPAPASPSVRLTPSPATKPMTRLAEKSDPVWLGLEHQPAEKWLERMAEYKRIGRVADANALLDEFRKRFPDHPASAR